MVWDTTDWTLRAPSSTLDACCHMTAWDESCVAIGLIAELAQLRGAVEVRNLLLPWSHARLLRDQRCLVMLLFDLSLLFFLVHEQLVCFAFRDLTDTSSYLDGNATAHHCVTVPIASTHCASCTRLEPLVGPVLGSLVDHWHVLEVVNVGALHHEHCATNL